MAYVLIALGIFMIAAGIAFVNEAIKENPSID